MTCSLAMLLTNFVSCPSDVDTVLEVMSLDSDIQPLLQKLMRPSIGANIISNNHLWNCVSFPKSRWQSYQQCYALHSCADQHVPSCIDKWWRQPVRHLQLRETDVDNCDNKRRQSGNRTGRHRSRGNSIMFRLFFLYSTWTCLHDVG